MDFCYNAIGGGLRSRIGSKLGEQISGSSKSYGAIFFFMLVVICVIAYMSLQIQKKKFEKKYIVALFVPLIFALIGGLFLILPDSAETAIKSSGPGYVIYIIIKYLCLFGSLLTFLILEILMGRDKF